MQRRENANSYSSYDHNSTKVINTWNTENPWSATYVKVIFIVKNLNLIILYWQFY